MRNIQLIDEHVKGKKVRVCFSKYYPKDPCGVHPIRGKKAVNIVQDYYYVMTPSRHPVDWVLGSTLSFGILALKSGVCTKMMPSRMPHLSNDVQ